MKQTIIAVLMVGIPIVGSLIWWMYIHKKYKNK